MEKEIKELMRDIEKLRINLEVVLKKRDWDLLDIEVLDASKKLNVVIVEYNKSLENKIDKKEMNKKSPTSK